MVLDSDSRDAHPMLTPRSLDPISILMLGRHHLLYFQAPKRGM